MAANNLELFCSQIAAAPAAAEKTPSSHSYQSLWHDSAVIMIMFLLRVVNSNLMTC